MNKSSERVSMITKYSATFSRCYALGISEDVIIYGIISIEIESNTDIYVYFGHPGQFMHVDTKSKVHSILSNKYIQNTNKITLIHIHKIISPIIHFDRRFILILAKAFFLILFMT